MPVFTDALIGDTTHLSTEEFGAYCLLLFATWRNNGQPFEDNSCQLARICRVSKERWEKRLRPVLVNFFDLSDGRWHQKRLEKEWKRVAEKVEANRKNGTLGGRPSALKNNETPKPNGFVSLNPEETQTEPNQTHIHISSPNGEDSPHKPPKVRKTNEPEGFAEWWDLYPNKVGQRAVRASYRSALARAGDPTLLLDGLHRYIQTKPPDRAWCNPTTWLNQDRWLDQPQEVQRVNGKHHNHDDQQSLFGEQKLTGLAAAYCRLREKYDRAGMD